MTAWLAAAAEVTATAFMGACLYVALVEHPARMRLGPREARRQFALSLPRAERMQPPLLIVTLALLGGSIGADPATMTVLGAIPLVAIVPLSFGALVPINRRLIDPGEGVPLVDVEPSLVRWGRLHAVRSALAVLGVLLLVVG